MSNDEQCGEIKESDGERCTYPSKHPDGRCGVHTECTDTDPGGRPSKFNDDRAQDTIRAAREGKSEAGCARAAGVDENCIGRWKDSNPTYTDQDGVEREFREAFTRARAKGETELIRGGMRDPDVDSSFAKFLLASSFDYVKEEKREVDMDANHSFDAQEGVSAEFVTFERDDGDE